MLFLYREVLQQELPWIEGVVRAKSGGHLPTVLSRGEVAAVLGQVSGVPLVMATALWRQLDDVRRQHASDLKAGAGWVELPFALARKLPNAGRELAWQWVFPATRLYVDRETRQRRRHHLHETVLQRAVREAAIAARMAKRVTCHTFRHSFATHLLEDGYDKQESLEAFWAMGLTDDQRAGIEAIAMDMWDPYVQATMARIPDAGDKIVFDRFHIAKHLNDAVDRVRRTEAKELKAAGDSRLVGTKYAWLRAPDNFDAEAWRKFAPLRQSNLKVARAWAIKETAAKLWDYRYVGAARTFFRRWYFWATHSRLAPMIEKARMIKRRLPNVLTYIKHRITNAASEGLNAKIQWIRYTARGFRNRENFKTAIYFHCGKLDLYPLRTHTNAG